MQVLHVRVLHVRTVLFARTRPGVTSVAPACPDSRVCSATLSWVLVYARIIPAGMGLIAGASAITTTSASACPAGQARTARPISTSVSRIPAKTVGFAWTASTITRANAIRLGKAFLFTISFIAYSLLRMQNCYCNLSQKSKT